MKNLKRALSFALASVMLLGMMVVGAGAVEFKDADKIEHTEAVNTMVALGVIAGKDTGDFDPEGTITRGEMAKIICVMLSGGKEPNLGTSAAAYPDTANHWANSYIAYCANLGIVAGDNHGNFNPDASVTGTEAAKMMLVALGYDSDVFTFTGAAWAINVNTQANKSKLYDDIDAKADAPLSRDNAAQMAYNALEAFIMEKTYDKVQSNGQISYNYVLSTTTTFLNEYFDGKVYIGTYVGNYNTGSTNNKGEITVSGKLDTAPAGTANVAASFPSDLDIANIGEEVKVIFKDGKGGTSGRPDKNDTIYGAFNTHNTEVYNVTKADIQDSESATKLKFGDNKYDIAPSVEVVTNYLTGASSSYTSATTLQAALKVQSVDAIKFVTNSDSEIAKAYVTVYYAGKVTGLTASKVTISGVGSIVLEDNDVYSDIAKDDIVVYTKFYDTDKDDAFFTVTKAETVEGELTGFKQDGSPATYKNVVVDGTTYKVETPAAAIANLTDDAITAPASGNIGDTVRLYLVGGMVAAIQSIEGGNGQYALVTEKNTGGTLGSNMEPIKVTVLLADGTKQTLNVHKDSKKNAAATAIVEADVVPGTLVEYTSIANGQIKIKSTAGNVTDSTAAATITGTSGGAARVWDKTTKTLVYTGTTGAVASSDAVAYVKVGTDYYAYNLRGLGNIANTVSGVKVGSYRDDGLVVAAYLELASKPGSSTADTLYGIVTGYVGTRTIDDDTYYRYTVAVGRDEDLEVNVNNNITLAAGDLIMFDEATDGRYTGITSSKNDGGDFTHLVTGDATAGPNSVIAAVKEYNESTGLLTYHTGLSRASISAAFTGATSSITVDKDVKIIYVDAKDNKGNDAIGVGAFDASTGYANIVFHKNSDGIVDAIIVETSGKANLDKYGSGKDAATSNFGGTATANLSVGSFGSIAPVDSGDQSLQNGAYTVTMPSATAPKGSTITITVATTGIDGGNSSEVVTVTYSVGGVAGQTAVLTFTSADASSQTFTVVAADDVTVTAFAVTGRTAA